MTGSSSTADVLTSLLTGYVALIDLEPDGAPGHLARATSPWVGVQKPRPPRSSSPRESLVPPPGDDLVRVLGGYASLTALDELLSGYRRAQRNADRTAPNRINIWDDPGLLRRDEVSWCRVLTWFLDPDASHGMGHRFLEGFLQEVVRLEAVGRIWAASVRVLREYRVRDTRIDILIELPTRTVAVEAKVGARVCHDQLERYQREMSASGREFTGVLLTCRESDLSKRQSVLTGFTLRQWSEVASWLSGEADALCGGSSEAGPQGFTARSLVAFMARNFASTIGQTCTRR